MAALSHRSRQVTQTLLPFLIACCVLASYKASELLPDMRALSPIQNQAFWLHILHLVTGFWRKVSDYSWLSLHFLLPLDSSPGWFKCPFLIYLL